MPRTLSLPLLGIALVSGLVFPTLAAYTGVYVTLCAMLLGLILLSSNYWDSLGHRSFGVLCLAVVLFAITLFFTYQSPNDLTIIALLAPIMLAPGMTFLLKECPDLSAPVAIALLCLAGAAGACVVGLNDVYLLHIGRAGGGNNPIHFGGMAIIVGFTSLIGLHGTKSAWRYLFLLGPVFGTIAAVLSGSRGPILAAGILAVFTIPLLIRWNWRQKPLQLIVALAAIICVGALTQVNTSNLPRALNVFGGISAIYQDQAELLDGETSQRMVLYNAAYKAFTASPIFGHGAGSFAAAAGKFMPDQFAGMRNSQHLHSDLADFATIGGTIGILAYLCLLCTPLLTFTRAQNQETRRALILGGLVLSVGYFSLGLTNAMFGILPQTTLFGVLLGVFVGMAQSEDALIS